MVLRPQQLSGSGTNILILDPFGQPYEMDAVHTQPGPGPGDVVRVGIPYSASTPPEEQRVDCKVWSKGQDLQETPGNHLPAPPPNTGVDGDNLRSF